MYSQKLLDLFTNPHNVGIIQGASGIGQFTDEKTSEVFKIYLKIEQNYIVNATFKVYSGIAGIAVMSILTDMLKNLSIENASNIEEKELLKQVETIDASQEYLLVDAIDTLKLAITDYQKKLEKEQEKLAKAQNK